MQKAAAYKIPGDYYIVMAMCSSMVIMAFFLDSPEQILKGFFRITTSRSVLVTDYIALAGIGAALINAAVSGIFYLVLLVIFKIEVTGRVIVALFLTVGFSLFGKNLTNMLPIFFGIVIYSKVFRLHFSNFLAQAMVSGTVGPIVSEIAFSGDKISFVRILFAVGAGLFIGFVFPVITEAAKRMDHGFCLYNGGIAGGFIATFFVGLWISLGYEVVPENFWDTEYSAFLSTFAYVLGAVLIVYGMAKDKPREALKKYWQLLKESDENNCDYLHKYHSACYINIGVLCIVTTSLMVFLGIPVNGPVLGGILTVAGFAAAGKHLRNTIPVLAGSAIAAHLNYYDFYHSSNCMAILFSTGLAPISGKYGWRWGMLTGFVHVSVAIIVGNLNGGMNLYNNGFAGGFVAITLVPLILLTKKLVMVIRVNYLRR